MLGYACINMTLSDVPKSKRVMTNRGMIKRTFDQKGLSYAGQLALENCKDLLTILEWNEKNNIRFFRVSSDLFPWMSNYEIPDLPQFHFIERALKRVGEFANKHNHRLTMHPGPFNKLAAEKEDIVDNTVKELNQHSQIFDLMGFAPSHYNKVNIHVGGTYGDKTKTIERFATNFEKLADHTQKRLTVENDDKASMYSTKDLVTELYPKINVPIVHDFHHHTFCTGELSQSDALSLAVTTWKDVKPVVHWSESRSKEKNDPKIKDRAHSDYVSGPIDTCGQDVDVMIEAKMKELALIQYRKHI